MRKNTLKNTLVLLKNSYEYFLQLLFNRPPQELVTTKQHEVVAVHTRDLTLELQCCDGFIPQQIQTDTDGPHCFLNASVNRALPMSESKIL